MYLRLFLEVKTCSKALLAPIRRYGESPCFSEVAFLQLAGPDYPLLVLLCVDGRFLGVCILKWKLVKTLFKT